MLELAASSNSGGYGLKIVALLARILLGLEFLVFGLNGFFHFIPQPPMPPGDMTTFSTLLFTSHYLLPVFVLQVIGGALLLIGRYVPLALTLLGPVIVNILITHIVFQPAGLPPGALAAVLWLVLFFLYREYFASLFTADAKPA
jgi:putative oxidoreductase